MTDTDYWRKGYARILMEKICVLSVCEKLRYSEIRREMYNITDAVLAATLKDLTESVWVIVKPKV